MNEIDTLEDLLEQYKSWKDKDIADGVLRETVASRRDLAKVVASSVSFQLATNFGK